MVRTVFIFIWALVFFTIAGAQDRNRYLLDLYDYEQELKGVVNKTTQALGGLAANRKVRSYKSEGYIVYRNGDVGKFDLYFLKENWARIDYNRDQEQHTFAIHGKKGWLKVSSDSGSTIKKLKRKPLNEAEYLHLYENNLFDYKWRGLDIYFEGEITSGATDAYVIRLTGFDYGEEVYYISKADHRPFMKQVYLLKGKNDTVINYVIEDYIKVDNVWLPKTVTIEGDTTFFVLNFVDYRLGTPLEKSIFTQ